MEKICLRKISKDSKLDILGHTFDGLAEVKNAVETYCRIGRESWNVEPKSPVEGIHVICVYEPYPCFDSEDYANENRDYSNYFFSKKPFTQQQISSLSNLPRGCNAQLVSSDMPQWAFPALYYHGEGDTIIIATLCEC